MYASPMACRSLLNVTSEEAGVGAFGVLLRSVEPLDGFEALDSTRRREQWADIGRGPGRLTKALKVDLRQDGLDIVQFADSPLWLAATAHKTSPIGKSVANWFDSRSGPLITLLTNVAMNTSADPKKDCSKNDRYENRRPLFALSN